MSQLKYHAATFAMLNHPVVLSDSLRQIVLDWEARHGIRLPPAIREWFEIEGATDMWRFIWNREDVFNLQDMKPRYAGFVKGKGETEEFYSVFDPTNERLEFGKQLGPEPYLLLSVETDCGIPTFVQLNGSDDPPVFNDPEDPNEPLRLIGSHFSAFIFDHLLLDGKYERPHCEPICATAKERLPTEGELALLREKFQSGPTSSGGWPGWHYRFFSDKAFVACGYDWYKEPEKVPIWEVRANSRDAFEDVIQILRPIANLGEKLAHPTEACAESNSLLHKELRVPLLCPSGRARECRRWHGSSATNAPSK